MDSDRGLCLIKLSDVCRFIFNRKFYVGVVVKCNFKSKIFVVIAIIKLCVAIMMNA